jgi:hypothetical protein
LLIRTNSKIQRKHTLMEFDLIGHLSPYTVIPSTFEIFEENLVDAFPTDSTRHIIFEGYKKYLKRLKDVVGLNFYQWIDGSYVTEKLNPNDIDIVTFLNYDIFFQKEHELINLISPESKLLFKVDAAFVPIFPLNHKSHYATQWDINFWKNFYSYTRPDTKKNKCRKVLFN